MHKFFIPLKSVEREIFSNLDSPQKIQDFLDKLPINFETKGDTLMSPRRILREKEAHCLEGALFAAAALLYHGKPAIILDLQPGNFKDDGHVVALFKRRGKWGAISKTNHAVLRFRDPIYNSPREIAMTYFHEYFLDDGRKTLRSYTVFNLGKIRKNWIIDENNLWYVDKALDKSTYINILTKSDTDKLRKASQIEIEAGKLVEWKK